MMDPDALQSVGVESERQGEEPTWSVIDENAAREDVATKENDQLTIRDLLPAEVNTNEGRELDLQPFSWKAQLGRVQVLPNLSSSRSGLHNTDGERPSLVRTVASAQLLVAPVSIRAHPVNGCGTGLSFEARNLLRAVGTETST